MFERFTDRARRAVVLAAEEARELCHDYVGPEHILLGIAHEGHGVGAMVLTSLGISDEGIRRQIEETAGRGEHPLTGHIPFTDRAKKTLGLATRESLRLGHDYIGTEHLLLGIADEGGCLAAHILVSSGADSARIHALVARQARQPEHQRRRDRVASGTRGSGERGGKLALFLRPDPGHGCARDRQGCSRSADRCDTRAHAPAS